MIRVTCHEKNGLKVGFTYRGHAGYSECGTDIVCAAVTAQLMMAVNGLSEVMKMPVSYESQDEGGYFTFSLDGEENIIKSQVMMETLYLGIKAVELQHADYITLTKEEV